MAKKTKSKQRLDKFYHYAKAQGYRSRAAYKLIQLNKKYSFLNTATTLIDLCAAPGGWLQVASELMPLNSLILGVDLDVIRHIPRTKTFQNDITTPQCYELLRKELQGNKCDVVLNDGAPNVGANWSKDAYTQSELVLMALKLACSFLRKDGVFVTKVFRSADFQSLRWVFNKLFGKVDVTKPEASRFTSAEIFVVCSQFLAPSFIDQKLFQAKWIFKDTQGSHLRTQLAGQITSIDKLLMQRRSRSGFAEDAPMHLHRKATLTQFIDSDTPLLIFAEFNAITTSSEQELKYFNKVKTQPTDLKEMFEDLKVLGKREVGSILKWRNKVRIALNRKTDEEKTLLKMSENKEIAQVQNEFVVDYQLDKELESARKRETREIRTKQSKKQQLMVKAELANEQHQEDDQQLFEQMGGNLFSGNQKIDQIDFEEEYSQQETQKKQHKYLEYDANRMQEDLQEMYEQKQRRIQQKKALVREAKEQRKTRRDQRHQNVENKLKSRNFRVIQREEKQQQQPETAKDLAATKFKNPLSQEFFYEQKTVKKIKINPDQKVPGQLSDDQAYVIPKPISDMEKRRNELKRKREKNSGKQEDQIQIIKKKPQKQHKMENYTIDELAQTLAIAKKMLRTRPRQAIIDSSYGRYRFEDHEQLPNWFTEDQKKHNYKINPISKAEFLQEKNRLMAINARVPKKILQARVRRKMRTQRKLRKTQKAAQTVMGQQGVDELHKLKQVGKMYDRSKMQLKQNKKYVVSKKGKSAKGKDSRNVVHVDRRLKKDKRIKKTRHVNRKHKRTAKF